MADIDADGDLDICVATYDSPMQLLINRGDAMFEDQAHEFGLDISNGARRLAATTLEAVILVNRGTKFEVRELPRIAQIAPSFGIMIDEISGDGYPEVFLAQNFHGPQPETGHMAGGVSLLLEGSANAEIVPMHPARSGIVVPGDATSCALVDDTLVVARNNDSVLAFKSPFDEKLIHVRISVTGARVTSRHSDGKSQTAEIHFGSGYLSQQPPVIGFGAVNTLTEIEVRWPDGKSTRHKPPAAGSVLTLR